MSKKALDLTGKKFGQLTALYSEKRNKKIYWICKCDCGNTTAVQTSSLIRNVIKSCGCLQKQAVKSRKQIKQTDYSLLHKKFNHLEVIGFNKYKLICRCDCGNIIELYPSVVVSNHTKSCGCMKNKKASERMNVINKTVFKEDTNIAKIASSKISKNNKTGIKGIFKNKKGYYVATIGFKKSKIYLGSYKKIEEAIKARKEAEEKYYKPILEKYNKLD